MEALAELFVPSSPSLTLPVLSDPVSLLSTDQDAIEQLIFENDTLPKIRNFQDDNENNEGNEEHAPQRQYCHPRKDFEELESLPSSQLFPAPGRMRKDELRVDNGLTPPMPSSSSVQSEAVTFNEQVETMLLDEYFSDFEFSRPPSLSEELLKQDDELFEVLKAASARVEEKLSREQLQEAATTKRFQMPARDDELPAVPWKKLEKQRFSKTFMDFQADYIADVIEDNQLQKGVTGLRKLQEGLTWSPFLPTLAQVALTEDIGSEEELRAFLKLVAGEDVTTSSTITSSSRMDGLRCLEDGEDDEDDELEPIQFVDPDEGKVDLSSLLRKRKRQLDDNGGCSSRHETASHGIPSPPSPALQQHAFNVQDGKRQGDKHHNLIGDFTSATTALDGFMEMRGKKKPKPTDSGYSKTIAVAQAKFAAPIPKDLAVVEPNFTSMPLPIINVPNMETPFIISTTLMQLRPIIKVITALFPTAQLIERDFSKHNNSSWMKGTVKRSTVVSGLDADAEADMILSPSTGVVITTLAKIKQKPLPGQKSEVKIRARLNAMSKRYSRVIIFVSEGNDNGTGILNGQDCMAFSDFVGFCSNKEPTITVVFIPGGAQTLGTWITSAMIKHGIHDGSQRSLMEDETVWELFLRRCGLNAYAAQSVAAAMRAPEGVDAGSLTKRGLFGLVGFVQMDHEKRVSLFGAILGGMRVLERVSAVIDTPWRLPTPGGQVH